MLLQETLPLHDTGTFRFHYLYFLPWKNQMVEGIQSHGGVVTNLPAKNNLALMLRYREVIRYIRRHDIRLVHCHLPWAGFLGRWIHRLTGVPVIYSEHNIQDRYHVITRTVNRLTFNAQTLAIAVSGDVARSIENGIHPRIPVKTILNGVNTDRFRRDPALRESQRRALGLSEDQVLIGTIAVFRFQKRLCEWIDLFALIHATCPQVRGCIVGDGLLKEQIMTHLRDRGMEAYIHFPGLQSEVRPWLSAMDLFMMTSSFEGLPIALLEAMSMECAIVSTDAGGIKEVIRDGEDGFLASVEEWSRLCPSAVALVQDAEMRRRFGAAARARVERSFSMKEMVRQLEETYQHVITTAKT